MYMKVAKILMNYQIIYQDNIHEIVRGKKILDYLYAKDDIEFGWL